MRWLHNRRCPRSTIAGNPLEQKYHLNHRLPASLGIAESRGDGREFDIPNSVELAASTRGQQPPWFINHD
jgi:hypothetical protein